MLAVLLVGYALVWRLAPTDLWIVLGGVVMWIAVVVAEFVRQSGPRR